LKFTVSIFIPVNERSRNQRGNQEWTIQRNGQSRMDNPEKRAIKNGQSRETGNQEWTIQRNGQSRMDNPEKRATLDTQDEDK
jgi:hypothetical protein